MMDEYTQLQDFYQSLLPPPLSPQPSNLIQYFPDFLLPVIDNLPLGPISPEPSVVIHYPPTILPQQFHNIPLPSPRATAIEHYLPQMDSPHSPPYSPPYLVPEVIHSNANSNTDFEEDIPFPAKKSQPFSPPALTPNTEDSESESEIDFNVTINLLSPPQSPQPHGGIDDLIDQCLNDPFEGEYIDLLDVPDNLL